MGMKDPRVDQFIEKAADFAKPVLRHLRGLVHKNCPSVAETIKWGMPSFTYHGILCMIAGFKQHCTFGFWHAGMRGSLTDDKTVPAMGQLGRITGMDDLPGDAKLSKAIKKAMKLNESGPMPRMRVKAGKPKEVVVPPDLLAALKRNKKAQAAFDQFSYSHRKEYVEWISEAKREETRNKRLATTIQWLAEGKPRNWKYQNG